jgi:hypothetical protein
MDGNPPASTSPATARAGGEAEFRKSARSALVDKACASPDEWSTGQGESQVLKKPEWM